MRKVVSGLIYDTRESELIGKTPMEKYTSHVPDDQYMGDSYCEYYRTKDDRFFEVTYDYPASGFIFMSSQRKNLVITLQPIRVTTVINILSYEKKYENKAIQLREEFKYLYCKANNAT